MAIVSARIEDWLKEEVELFWRQHGEKPATGLRRSLQEWWVTQNLPAITFRDGPAGRRAAVRAGPDVWELALVARQIGHDPAALAGHFGGRIAEGELAQALAYAERFPGEIEAALAENDRLERLLGAPGAP